MPINISTVSNEVYSNLGGLGSQAATSLDNQRRVFALGDKVAELQPQRNIFFAYLNRHRKEATNDAVFKMLEQRHQWQRRNFSVKTSITLSTTSTGQIATTEDDDLVLVCDYDKFGRLESNCQCRFLLPGQVITLKSSEGNLYNIRIDTSAAITHSGTDGVDGATTITLSNTGTQISFTRPNSKRDASTTITFNAGGKGQVVGSAFAEATGAPEGWRDELYDREGYTQIFKTAVPLMSGTSLATEYRGIKNEWKRIWLEKILEHNMDQETACMFGFGQKGGGTDIQYSWGILPYTELYGKNYDLLYDNFSYDKFLDISEDFFAPESGNSMDKLVLCSRKILNRMNRLGETGFIQNTFSSRSFNLDVQNIKGSFGQTVTKIDTLFGNFHFVASPLLRGVHEDYAIAVDLANVKWRPLKGNGISRDTFVKTNIQDNDVDGRVDLITTEAGLQIDLPETHAILKFA